MIQYNIQHTTFVLVEDPSKLNDNKVAEEGLGVFQWFAVEWGKFHLFDSDLGGYIEKYIYGVMVNLSRYL